MNFIRVILIIALVYYGLKLIGRFLFPWLLKRWVTGMQQRHADAFGRSAGGYPQEEGKVTVHPPQSPRKSRSNEGDYVDFEEVK